MFPRTLAGGLTAASLVVLTAACGSSGSSPSGTPISRTTSPPLGAAAYRSALHQVAMEENAAQHQVQRAFHAHTVAEVRATLTAFAADQREAAQRVAAITPPANASTANAQLAHAFSDNAVAIDALLTRLGAATTVKQALHAIQNDRQAQQVGHEIDSALSKLHKLGYTSGS